MVNHQFSWENPLSMVIFHSYFDPGIAAPAAEPRDSASSKPFSKAGRRSKTMAFSTKIMGKSWENRGNSR